MYKGYDIRKGKDAESFKEYLRTRNIYFEPSENGNRIHFEVERSSQTRSDLEKTLEQHLVALGLDNEETANLRARLRAREFFFSRMFERGCSQIRLFRRSPAGKGGNV